MTEAQRVKVKRDGPRGWHWIAAHHFDPARHEMVTDDTPSEPTVPQQVPAAPKAARAPKAKA